jgi:secreted trypsin-like serine protease
MHKSILGVVAALTILVGDQATAEPENYMRERVRQWQIRAMENALGKEQAARLLAAKANAEIVGGTTAAAGSWPWQVGLVQANITSNFNAQFCGGTLVDDLFVVTAAHCITEHDGSVTRPRAIRVLTGTQSLTSGGTRRGVERIERHPRYNDDTTDFDIAVIKLTTPVPGKKVRLLTGAQEAVLAAAGDRAIVTGWGSLNGGNNFPTALQQVNLPIVSSINCNDANSYNGAITTRMFCAGQTGKDSCQGDSGGPLVVRDSLNRYQLLAGVVSWGIGCALANKYGVYSRVAVLRRWIIETMTELSPEVAAREESTNCADLRGASQSTCLDGLSLAPK